MVGLLSRLGLVGLSFWGLLSCAVDTSAETRDRPTPSPSSSIAPSPSPAKSIAPTPTAQSCRTFIKDKNPPTNLRSSPEVKPGNIVGTLTNGTTLTVAAQQNSWLQVSAPQAGWVAVSTTAISCVPPGGSTRTGFRILIPQLGDRAINGDRLSADLLARYSLQADGVFAEALSSVLVRWAQKNPSFLVAVLDGQPDNIRRRSLGLVDYGLNPQARQQFTSWVSKLPPESLTRQVWESQGYRPQKQ